MNQFIKAWLMREMLFPSPSFAGGLICQEEHFIMEPVVNEAIATRTKQFIDKYPEAGYRTATWMLKLNKNTVQRIFQLKGWQVRKKLRGFRPRVKAFPNPISVGQLI